MTEAAPATGEVQALARIATMTDEAALRRLMANAKSLSPTVHDAAFRRLIEVSTTDHDDPVTRACWRMVHTIEQVRRDLGRAVWKMNRLRPKIAKDGAIAALNYCARNETEGFAEVLGYGLPEYTAEAIVLGFPETFAADTRIRASARLRAAGIDPDLYDRGDR